MLVLVEGLLRETLKTLRRCGGRQDECVAYWAGPLGRPDVVDEVLHPVHKAGPAFYEVEATWLNATWLKLASSHWCCQTMPCGMTWRAPASAAFKRAGYGRRCRSTKD
jgi:hypothetical protein